MQIPEAPLFILMAVALSSGLATALFSTGYANVPAFVLAYAGSFALARPLARQAIRVVERDG